jgi:hypothetical protein
MRGTIGVNLGGANLRRCYWCEADLIAVGKVA